jgi:hypothetical protein
VSLDKAFGRTAALLQTDVVRNGLVIVEGKVLPKAAVLDSNPDGLGFSPVQIEDKLETLFRKTLLNTEAVDERKGDLEILFYAAFPRGIEGEKELGIFVVAANGLGIHWRSIL